VGRRGARRELVWGGGGNVTVQHQFLQRSELYCSVGEASSLRTPHTPAGYMRY
jgi:hypothetical protein